MRRIAEDPEQNQWLGSVMPGEVRLLQTEAEGNGRHNTVTQLSQCSVILENDRPELRHVLREKIRTVQRNAGRHKRVISVELGTEIYPLFHVGISGREFPAYWKIPSPRSASARHANFKLRLKILGEKSPTESFKPFLQDIFNSVPNDIKESELMAGISD